MCSVKVNVFPLHKVEMFEILKMVDRVWTGFVVSFQHHGDSVQCKFREEITRENYTKFRSAAPALWYVGFRSNGKPVKGYKGNRPEKCYQFLKKEDTKRFQPGPDGLKIHDFEAILRRRGHRLRRRHKSARVRSRG